MQAIKQTFLAAAMLLSILALTVLPLQAAQFQLSWTAPTRNADGTALTDLAGYRLYYGQQPGIYTFNVDVEEQTTYTLETPEHDQTYYFAVVAYDTSGNVSGFSDEVSATPSPDGITRISLPPQEDTHININSSNYSTATILGTYTWPDNKIANAVLLKFDLSNIPQGSIIHEAKLNLALTGSDSTVDATYSIAVHKLTNKNPMINRATGYTYDGSASWTPNACCHQNIPLAQADISFSYDVKAIDKVLGYKSWTITSMIKEWIDNPSTNFGLLLNSDPSKLRDRYRYFASNEHSNASLRPYLSIAYSPLSPLVDTDGDGLSDDDEINIYGTNPILADTDGDGNNDGAELIFWGAGWDADADGDGIINLLDPDSDNDGYLDGLEIQYGSDPAGSASKPLLIEVGEVNIDHNWQRIALNLPFLDPVVVAKPPSYNDMAPAVVRIRNVTRTGFDMRIQEWDYLDGTHAAETVGYIVMERGRHTLQNGTLVEVGSFNTGRTSSFGSFKFSQPFKVIPVMIAAVSSFNEAQAVTGRLKSISTTGFQFRMQEQERNQQTHATETIAYVAWEPSSGQLNGLTFEVNRTPNSMQEQFQSILFTMSFVDTPAFIADMQTTNGGDPVSLRWDTKDPSGVYVKVEEEQSYDSETDHGTEVVGYFVIQ